MKQGLILSTAYAPPITYIAHLYEAYINKMPIYIEANEHYIKQTYRSRCYIGTSIGIDSLSIPIEHPADKVLIKDIRLSLHGSWQKKHLSAIKTAYGATPFYEYYSDDFNALMVRKENFLWDFNWHLLEYILKILSVDIVIQETQSFSPSYSGVSDLRYKLSPKSTWVDDTIGQISYYDVFDNRTPIWLQRLSIIDLIYNMGPESVLILKEYIKKKQSIIQ